MDLRQTPEYADYLVSIGWKVKKDKKTKSNIYIRKLPLTPFSVLKIQRPDKLVDINDLKKIVHKHRVVQTNIETLDDNRLRMISDNGYKRNKIPFLPSTTILLDLTIPEKNLLSMMKSKTRYNVKLAKKRDVEIKIFDGTQLIKNLQIFDDLFAMQKQNAKRLGIFVLLKKWFVAQVKSFGKKCFAVMAYKDNELVAATFYMTSDDGVYYSHNGSTHAGRGCFAPTLCVWEGILEGKRRKLKVFDFEGIYDERSKVIKWQGFTRFKEGFGGRKVMYPGLYSKWHFFNF